MTDTPTVISLFSGAMGLDLGFEQAGFEIRVAVDKDRYAEQTIKANRPSVEIIRDDIGSGRVAGQRRGLPTSAHRPKAQGSCQVRAGRGGNLADLSPAGNSSRR